MASVELAQVAVARPLRNLFTYQVPPALAGRLTPGQRLLVPFGRGMALGFYVGPAEAPTDPSETARLKPIARALEDAPALPRDVLALVRFAADHYRSPLGEALRSALPPGLTGTDEVPELAPEQVRYVVATAAAATAQLGRARAQAAALSYLLAVGGRAPMDELGLAIPGSRDAVQKLVARGLVVLEDVDLERTAGAGGTLAGDAPLVPTAEQAAVLATLTQSLDAGAYRPFLLQGVTGSGKTEVYLRAADHALRMGRGVLVLVPEIALTPQLVGRFRSRFGSQVALLHSALGERERLRDWQQLRAGRARIAVGVRSAVFSPVQNLGLVVVDEEHDPSFKQEEKLRYQARDLAVVRAKQTDATLVLGSATPSLESLLNAQRERYGHLRLTARVEGRPLPRVELVDLRRGGAPRGRSGGPPPPVLGTAAEAALEETLSAGRQAILFINRRGDRTFLTCERCGIAQRCRQCDVSLTRHRAPPRLLCHYCGESRPVPSACPECSGVLLELGAGTERVEAEVSERFPKARVGRLDRDAAGSADRLTELLAAFARRELDVLVGTQMVAKGHDFPGVTLVVVVLADTLLALPDFRAAERTFQLLTQVSGRAGRGSDPGRVLIQTYSPDAQSVSQVAAHDYDAFARYELSWREALLYPPYARLAALRLEGADPAEVERIARGVGGTLAEGVAARAAAGVRMLGPAPAPLARLRGKTRWQLLLQAPRHPDLVPLLARAEALATRLPRAVRLTVDVDPWSML